MILLSQQGLSAAQIADLLGYDSATVRRWIHRYHQHGTGGLADLHQHIRNLPTGAAVLAEDETRINLLPWVRATWILRGQRQQIMTPGKNRRRTIFGAVDLRAGRFSYQVTRKAISATFTTFCEHLLAAYPQAPVVAVVCDNVSIHRSKIVQRWLKTHPRGLTAELKLRTCDDLRLWVLAVDCQCSELRHAGTPVTEQRRSSRLPVSVRRTATGLTAANAAISHLAGSRSRFAADVDAATSPDCCGPVSAWDVFFSAAGSSLLGSSRLSHSATPVGIAIFPARTLEASAITAGAPPPRPPPRPVRSQPPLAARPDRPRPSQLKGLRGAEVAALTCARQGTKIGSSSSPTT
jgi:hypothetical protein